MLFSSWVFVAGFLPVVLLGFYFLQKRAGRGAAMLFLAAASLVFYGWMKPEYVLIILLSMAGNFGLGMVLSRPRLSGRSKNGVLSFGVAANLLALFYYKYTGFFFETLNGFGTGLDVPDIVLPLAISFFTFQQIAYLVDAWRGETRELDFTNYTLFVTFFPQLIAGPIVHHKEIIPQFEKMPSPAARQRMIVMGMTAFIIGLFKKVVIADNMGEIADPIFDAAAMGTALTLIEVWLGVLSYTLQIYFDFSGYSDMAAGLAALFGVKMPVNFLSPYKSADISEFWRRWHITLSRFLRDYLYIPLGGNRKGVFRRYLNLMVTMLLGGLWHGANWTFVIWGGLHGAFLVLHQVWQKISPFRLPRMAGVFLTFLAVMVAWIFFRAENADTAFRMIHAMTGVHGVTLQNPDGIVGDLLHLFGIDAKQATGRLLRINEKWYILWVALGVVFFAPNVHQLMRQKLALSARDVLTPLSKLYWRPTKLWAIAVSLMATLSLLLLTKVNAFIYFQF